MKTKSYKESKALIEARVLVNTLAYGTETWEAAMVNVRKLVQAETDADQAILNHRCKFDRD